MFAETEVLMAQAGYRQVPVFSSNLKTAAYSTRDKTLVLTFVNRPRWEYIYYHVSPKIWNAFLRAESKGKYFAEYIRDQYQYSRRILK
jgi:hypothetical protein